MRETYEKRLWRALLPLYYPRASRRVPTAKLHHGAHRVPLAPWPARGRLSARAAPFPPRSRGDSALAEITLGPPGRAAGLEVVAEVLKTEAVFIANPRCGHPAMVERLKKRIEGHLTATRYQMVQYNVHRDNMPKVAEITPGKRAPTVSPLDTDGWCAVSALVLKKLVSEKMDALQAAGATDILVFDIANSRGF